MEIKLVNKTMDCIMQLDSLCQYIELTYTIARTDPDHAASILRGRELTYSPEHTHISFGGKKIISCTPIGDVALIIFRLFGAKKSIIKRLTSLRLYGIIFSLSN